RGEEGEDHRDNRYSSSSSPTAPPATSPRKSGKEEKSEKEKKEKKEAKRIKAELKTSHAVSLHAASSSTSSSRELQAFFGDETAGDLDDDEKRKHKPLTKLEEHRDVTNKLQRAKETMKVIENSKKILASVPTDREKLFTYPIDWSLLNSKNILELKLRPWIRKKICELMGTDEVSIVYEVIDYILQRVSDQPHAEDLLRELSKFLDEEAEGFLKNMWRLLIFEQLKLSQANHNTHTPPQQ
ncbi:pwi domain-containing protein, partial [Cystoisospora suis]